MVQIGKPINKNNQLNLMKKNLPFVVVIGLFFIIPLLSLATNEVTLSPGGNSVISVAGYSLNTEGSGATIDSITVYENYFTVTISSGGRLKITSADKRKFEVSNPAGNITITTTCEDSQSTVNLQAITGQSASVVTITPSTSETCSSGSSVGPVSGGGGGGGESYLPRVTPTPTPTTTSVPAVTVAIPSSVASSISPVFTSTLIRGMSNENVKRLQTLLATDPSIYPEGTVSGFFGPATERAVKAFQTKYGLSPVGQVGPQTRAKLAEIFGK